MATPDTSLNEALWEFARRLDAAEAAYETADKAQAELGKKIGGALLLDDVEATRFAELKEIIDRSLKERESAIFMIRAMIRSVDMAARAGDVK
jgi:hypothetical protein